MNDRLELSGMTFSQNEKIIGSFGSSIDKLNSKFHYKSAFDLFKEELIEGCILSFNETLDELLKNVIIPKRIIEFTGSSDCTTPICMKLCVSVQLPKTYGGHGGEAFYLSTNGNFSSEKLRELASDFIEEHSKNVDDFNVDIILNHVYYTKVNSLAQLMACIFELELFLTQKQIRLLIVDSISYVLRQLEGSERFKIINKIFQILRYLSEKYNLSVILTNFPTTRINGDIAYTVASFGDSFYHLVNSRISFTRNAGFVHANLMKNVANTEKQVVFKL